MNPKTTDEFVSNKFKEYLKIYLVLKYKGYSWKTELQNSFSIADSIVHEGLKILEKEGFVISKDFWSLDLDLQESIRRLNGAYFKKINSYPKIYILNEDETRTMWYELHKEEIEKLIKGDGSITHTLEILQQKTNALKKTQKEFTQIEENELERYRNDDSGVLYVTDTKRKKQLMHDLKKGIIEFKQELLLEKQKKGLLSNSENKELAIINEKGTDLMLEEESIKLKNRYTCNGEDISSADFNFKIQEIEELKKEDLRIEKGLEKDIKIKKQIDIGRSKGENVPHIQGMGLSPEEINQEMINRLDDWEVFLGLKEKRETKLNDQDPLKEKFEILKDKLWGSRYLDVFFALDFLGSKTNLHKFQEYIKHMPVTFNGDDFIYNG